MPDGKRGIISARQAALSVQPRWGDEVDRPPGMSTVDTCTVRRVGLRGKGCLAVVCLFRERCSRARTSPRAKTLAAAFTTAVIGRPRLLATPHKGAPGRAVCPPRLGPARELRNSAGHSVSVGGATVWWPSKGGLIAM